MSAQPHQRLYSVDEYLALEADADVRHEYLGGYLYAMAGARNVHNTIATNALGHLYGQLRGRPCRPFNSDTKVRVQLASHTRFYYPDAMIVCAPSPAEATYQDHPVVIVEVVSEGTRRLDEVEKREAYLAIPSLRAYLLVEQDAPLVRVYRRVDQGFEVELHEGMEAVVPLAEVEAELPLAAAYERVEFVPEPRATEE